MPVTSSCNGPGYFDASGLGLTPSESRPLHDMAAIIIPGFGPGT